MRPIQSVRLSLFLLSARQKIADVSSVINLKDRCPSLNGRCSSRTRAESIWSVAYRDTTETEIIERHTQGSRAWRDGPLGAKRRVWGPC